MAAKKTITGGSSLEHTGDRAAILHDERVLNQSYKTPVRRKVAKEFDTGFQQAFHPVYPTFVNKADLTYPQSIAADFIGGYLRSRLLDGATTDQLGESVLEFDDSWTHHPPSVKRLNRKPTATCGSGNEERVTWTNSPRKQSVLS